MDTRNWMPMYEYPNLDIHIRISIDGHPCMGINIWVSIFGHPYMGIHIWIPMSV